MRLVIQLYYKIQGVDFMISPALEILETEEQRNELSDFYEQYKERFYAIAFSKLHNRASAEDAVQEAFLRIADKPDKFFGIPGDKRAAFTDVIIRHIAVDMFNKSSRTGSLDETVGNDFGDVPLEERVISSVSRDELIGFISTLSSLQRDVLELKILYGASNSEIAQKLSVSENVVRQRLFQARKAIREYLEKGGSSDV